MRRDFVFEFRIASSEGKRIVFAIAMPDWIVVDWYKFIEPQMAFRNHVKAACGASHAVRLSCVPVVSTNRDTVF